MLNLLKQWLESTHFLKIFASLIVVSFVTAVNLTFCILKIKDADFSSATLLHILGVVLIILSFGCLVFHAICWKGFDLPFPIARPEETVNGEWEHCLGHEYYFGLAPLFILTCLISGWLFCLILLIGFAIGMRRGWNYDDMVRKI